MSACESIYRLRKFTLSTDGLLEDLHIFQTKCSFQKEGWCFQRNQVIPSVISISLIYDAIFFFLKLTKMDNLVFFKRVEIFVRCKCIV